MPTASECNILLKTPTKADINCQFMSEGVGISSLLAKLAARVLPTQVDSWRRALSEQQTPSLKLAQSSSQILFDITKACIDLYPFKSHVA